MARPRSGFTPEQLDRKYREQGTERRHAAIAALGGQCGVCGWGHDERRGHYPDARFALTVFLHGNAIPSNEWRHVKTGKALLASAEQGDQNMELVCINCQTVSRFTKEAVWRA